ncbi:CopD family protein [Parasphingorhabdus litoris]|uniref:CopD family protein n=1 Tax=Parasphingorhabdus litoris TaxID=394733 RepID=UPI001E4B9E2B|nr:CopD family protein [Parasphingorhabdus litoris]
MYELVRIGHFICLIVWIGGLFAATSITSSRVSKEHGDHTPLLWASRRAVVWIVTPAMIGTIAFGLVLAQITNQFSQGWLLLKLCLVLFLVGMNGVVAGTMRRAVFGELVKAKSLFFSQVIILIFATLVVAIAVTRPSFT